MKRRVRAPAAREGAGEPAGERLHVELTVPTKQGFGLGPGLGLGKRLRAELGALTAVRVRDRFRRNRVVHEVDCGDAALAERTFEMMQNDLRAKTLDEFLDDYGIDELRVP